ncbi:MAG: hypothetical protein ACREU6_18530 [Steroidobacteraceae bacterium]
MITLTFSPLSAGSPLLVRGLFFRICGDSTLRGPDSTVVATYTTHTWQVGARSYREFHSNDSVFLRVKKRDARHERLGPYEFLRAAEGALFVNGQRIGTYSPEWNTESALHDCWHEITLLSAATEVTWSAAPQERRAP